MGDKAFPQEKGKVATVKEGVRECPPEAFTGRAEVINYQLREGTPIQAKLLLVA